MGDRETSELQHITEHLTSDWNAQAEVVQENGILQHGNGMAVNYNPFVVASPGICCTPPCQALKLSAVLIAKKMLSRNGERFIPMMI